jgi:hypothetical protein
MRAIVAELEPHRKVRHVPLRHQSATLGSCRMAAADGAPVGPLVRVLRCHAQRQVCGRSRQSLWRSGPPRPGTRSARHGESDASLDEGDPLLPKPVRALLSPARTGNGAGRGCFVVVRGCPLGTVQDRCEWHACGTASEDDPRTPWRRWLRLDRRVRAALGDHRLGAWPDGVSVQKSTDRAASAGGSCTCRRDGPSRGSSRVYGRHQHGAAVVSRGGRPAPGHFAVLAP